MRHCYLCDATIRGDACRRWVDTGTFSRSYVGASRRGGFVSGGGGSRTGLRTVCGACANAIDDKADYAVRCWQAVFQIALCAAIGCFLGQSIENIYHNPARPYLWFSFSDTSHDP